jgi:hypothetical protein
MRHSVLADLKKRCFEALIIERFENRLGAAHTRAIIERQNDFVVAKQFRSVEMLFSAEAQAPDRGDLDNARNPHGARLVAG